MRRRPWILDLGHLNWLLPSGRDNFSAAKNLTAVSAYSRLPPSSCPWDADAACLLLSPLPVSCISISPCTRFPLSRFSLITVFPSPSPMCMRAKSLQSYPTLCDPRDCSPPGSSLHGILQARTLEWVAMPSSRGSSWLRNQTCVSRLSCTAPGFFTPEPQGKPWWTAIALSSFSELLILKNFLSFVMCLTHGWFQILCIFKPFLDKWN